MVSIIKPLTFNPCIKLSKQRKHKECWVNKESVKTCSKHNCCCNKKCTSPDKEYIYGWTSVQQISAQCELVSKSTAPNHLFLTLCQTQHHRWRQLCPVKLVRLRFTSTVIIRYQPQVRHQIQEWRVYYHHNIEPAQNKVGLPSRERDDQQNSKWTSTYHPLNEASGPQFALSMSLNHFGADHTGNITKISQVT